MGMFWVVALVLSMVQAETAKVISITDTEAIKAEYCRVETGAHFDDCGMPANLEKLDVFYVPEAMGKRIEGNIRDSFNKGYYFNLDKQDLFHGHFMGKGPGTNYASADAYFADVQVSLYHSKEYLHSWETIPLEDSPFSVRPPQRSFVGKFFGTDDTATAAIDLIRHDIYPEPYPIKFLRGYKTAGTIYTEEINESQSYSAHKHTTFGGHEQLYVNSCSATDKDCKPCRIFSMAYILEQKDGRFVSPDGKRFDVTVHCRYINEH